MGSKVAGASIRFWAVVLVGEDSVGGKCEEPYVIVNGSEDLLWRYKEACHLPYCHLEIHLGKFE